MISSLKSVMEKPFFSTTTDVNSQPVLRHRKSSRFNTSIVTRISLAAVGLLTLCLNPTPVSAANWLIFPLQKKETLHKQEIYIQTLFGAKALHLDPKDSRPKLLYLMAEYDEINAREISHSMSFEEFNKLFEDTVERHSQFEFFKDIKGIQKKATKGDLNSINYLNILKQNAMRDYLTKTDQGIGRVIMGLNKKFDVRFKVILNTSEICTEIAKAAKIGDVESLIINAPGAHNSLSFSKTNAIMQHPHQPAVLLNVDHELLQEPLLNTDNAFYNDEILKILAILEAVIDKNCFSGLSPGATISLLSSSTGQSPTGIASALSKLSQRIVWAPKEQLAIVKTAFSSHIPPVPTFMPLHSEQHSIFDDMACKFFPDGSSACGAWNTKTSQLILPIITDLSILILLSVPVIYGCTYLASSLRFWINRKIAQYKVRQWMSQNYIQSEKNIHPPKVAFQLISTQLRAKIKHR